MAKYEVKHSCGHTETIQLYGPHKNREWVISKEEEKLCSDCWQEHLKTKREKDFEKAKKENEKRELPDLIGTPKQIAWAETIRAEFFRLADLTEKPRNEVSDNDLYFHIGEDLKSEYRVPKITEEQYAIMIAQDMASFWIENRNLKLIGLINSIENIRIKNLPENQEKAKIENMLKKEFEEEIIISPEKPVSKTIARITVVNNFIKVHFPERNDEFISTVKALGFSWSNPYWTREIGTLNGTIEDRYVEICNKLLKKGFTILAFRADLKDKILKEEYNKEVTRWVKVVTSESRKGWFLFSFPKSGYNYYDKIKSIKGFEYYNHSILVSPENYEQVIDFAEKNGFGISEGAKKIVEYQKNIQNKVVFSGLSFKEAKELVDKELMDGSAASVLEEFLDK
jgi:hypothetical protein